MNIIIVGSLIILMLFLGVAYTESKESPRLVGPETPKDNAPMKTYVLTTPEGDKEYIMTTKSLKELLSELDYLANKKEFEQNDKEN